MSQHQFTTTRNERVEAAVAAVRKGRGVLVVDDEDRENEGDIIFSAASITHEQMALLIRECSGIVCLCLPEDKVRQLDLPQMVANNTCKNRTAFTISIEAAEGVTTGVSAAVAIANRILKEGAPAVADYKKFLSGGCSTDPISLLKIAGVDMSSPEPVNSALALFGELVDEMEQLV